MIAESWYVLGLGLPAVIAALALVVPRLASPKVQWLTTGPGWSIGIACGFFAGYHALDGWPPIPPTESQHWLVAALLPLAVLLSSLAPFQVMGGRVKLIIRALQAILILVTPIVLLLSYLRYDWTVTQAVMWLAGLGGAGVVVWLAMDLMCLRRPGRSHIVTLMLTAGATGMVIMMSGSQSIGLMGLSLAATLGGAWLASWYRPIGSDSPSSMAVVMILLIGLWLNGHFYAELSAVHAILLASTPLTAWLCELPPVRSWSGWKAVAVRLTAVLVPLGIAVGLAGWEFSQAVADPYYR